MSLPPVVSMAEWQASVEAFRAQEKDLTCAHDALNAERRRLPMAKIEKDYVFQGPNGPAGLLDLFEGRLQLIIYHFMLGPDAEDICSGCAMVVDNMGHPAHLYARDTSRVLISRAPYNQIEPVRTRMGWREPWYSSFGSDFNHDFGVTTADGEGFALSVLLRDDNDIYRTYFTRGRGVEHLGSNWTYLDLTPFGRQETWEDSPAGRPGTAPYEWWRLHDEYGDE